MRWDTPTRWVLYRIAEEMRFLMYVFFKGKRLWLKPGSTRLFGRTRGHSEFGSLDERMIAVMSN